MTSKTNTPESLISGDKGEKGTAGRRRSGIAMGTTAVASALATLGASALGTIAANKEDPLAPRGKAGIEFNVGAGYQDILPGDAEFRLPGVHLDVIFTKEEMREISSPGQPGGAYIKLVRDNKDVLMEYAEKYAQSPESEELNGPDDNIQETLKVVQGLISNGYMVQVGLEGLASDENISTMPAGSHNPGFGIPEPKNVELAEKRGNVIYDLLMESAKDQGIDLSNVQFTISGREVEDSDLAQRIEEIAQRRNLSALALVRAYNDDDPNLGLTRNELNVLSGLDKYRAVEISVIGCKIVKTPGVAPGRHEVIERDSKQVTVVFIPVLIPIFRRKSGTDNSEAGIDEPPQVIGCPPPPQPGSRRRTEQRRGKGKLGKPMRGQSMPNDVIQRRIQPGRLNDGGNRGSRGQRNPHSGPMKIRGKGRGR
jgi:hypothetical protein